MVDVKLNPEHGSMEQRLAKRDRTSADVAHADAFHEHRPGVQVKTTAVHHSRNKQHGDVRKGEPGYQDRTAHPTLPKGSNKMI